VRVVYESAGGIEVYATPWRDLDVSPGGLKTVVTQYWN
jgi:hypothetical protein